MRANVPCRLLAVLALWLCSVPQGAWAMPVGAPAAAPVPGPLEGFREVVGSGIPGLSQGSLDPVLRDLVIIFTGPEFLDAFLGAAVLVGEAVLAARIAAAYVPTVIRRFTKAWITSPARPG